MIRFLPLFVMMFSALLSFGQNISITFTGTGEATRIDSVKATNLATSQSVTLPGGATLILTPKTGISSVSEFSDLGLVFPNPFSGQATVTTIVQKPQTVHWMVQNLVGQVVAETDAFVQTGENSFALSINTAGIYLVSQKTDQGTTGYKVICTGASGSGNRIQYLSSGFNNHNNQNNLNNPSQPRLKSLQSIYSLGYSTGEIIHYQCTSGTYVTFLTDSPVTSKNYDVEFVACMDPDGKNYPVVKIGDQTWMAGNLAYLPAVSLSSAGSITEKHYYVYGYDGSIVSAAKAIASYDTYGALYNWEAARWACPGGWHLPSDAEWTSLTEFLGSPAGGRMKESGTARWSDPNTGATNESGFAARPGGFRKKSGGFSSLGDYTAFWSSSLDTSSYPWYRYLLFDSDATESDHRDFKDQGFSVRCVKGNTAPTASFTINTAVGTIETRFTFDASASTDAETPADDLEVRWDFNGDGIWDTEYSKSKITIYQYSLAGSYSAKLEVKDGGGQTHAQTQMVTITYLTITDSRDGNIYPYKTIGTQIWMVRNMAWLPSVSPTATGSNTAPFYYVFGYQGSIIAEAKATANYGTYGVLYNFDAAKTACPAGWHLPSDDEWTTLTGFLGTKAGGKMKEAGFTHWLSPNTGATNSSGFTALPGGFRFDDGSLRYLRTDTFYWTSTEIGEFAWDRALDNITEGFYRGYYNRNQAYSVRCMKN